MKSISINIYMEIHLRDFRNYFFHVAPDRVLSAILLLFLFIGTVDKPIKWGKMDLRIVHCFTQ